FCILSYNLPMTIKFHTDKYYTFDNFSPHAVEYEGKIFPTSEHAYQAAKFTSDEIREAIRGARSPLQAKELANVKYKNDKDPDWDSKKVDVMERVLRAKLTQHFEVAEALERSRSEELAENSPVDYFWGIGADGTGQNMLGKLWMKLRDEHN
ncbi:MAG: hypothetical protein JWL85_29, partial [Candidatus Saccharibacteria bacterium]|nr:hypothetical protein [Candidatus Saccharibacteria bacterium]